MDQTANPNDVSLVHTLGFRNVGEGKTRITHIEEGFDFLGWNLRKHDGKLLIKPSKKNVQAFLDDIRETVKANKMAKQELLKL